MMLDTKKLIILSVVAIAVIGGAGYHLMQKMERKNIDAQQILSKSNNELIIAGKTIQLDNNKDYDILIKRVVTEGKDYLLRDILSEQEYQYLKTAYFKKIEDKLLEFEKRKEEINKQVADFITHSKKKMNTGAYTQKEYDNWHKELKVEQTKKLQEIEKQEDFFISKRPFLQRFELVQLIDNYYKKNPNITTKNNEKIRSLSLSQILEGRGKGENEFNTYLAFDEILLNIKIALKYGKKNTITLKDLLPHYEKELTVIDELDSQLKTVKGINKINRISSEITRIKLTGL